MELPGTGFLYTIATLSITYAGFTALIVIFRIPTPVTAKITLGLSALTAIALLMNALGIFGQLAAGPFVMSVTAFLVLSFYVYLSQMEVMLRGPTKK